MSSPGNMRAITQERKLLTIAAMRELAVKFPLTQGHIAFAFIVGRLEQLHEAGLWPQADWSYARNEPYDTGTRQHMQAMKGEGWVAYDDRRGWRVTDKAPATEPLPKPRPLEERAADLLPDPDEVEHRLVAYERTFGHPIVLGVDFSLCRVIRYRTDEGMVEIPVEDGDWNRALTEVGA